MKIFKNTYLHPLTFSIYPIIFVYSQNVQILSLHQLYRPLILSLTLAVVFWLVFFKILRSHSKASIVVTVTLVAIFTYGPLYDWLTSFEIINIKDRHLVPTVLFLVLNFTFVISKIRNNNFTINISKTIGLIVGILVTVNLIGIVPVEWKKATTERKINPDLAQLTSQTTSNCGDIYYIILDEFASLSTIKNIWGYDPGSFVRFLEEHDFYIAEESKSTSIDTLYVIGSNLNMRDIDITVDMVDLSRLTSNNKVMSYLKSNGYTTVVLDGTKVFYPNKTEILADYSFDYDEENNAHQFSSIDDFSEILLDMSMFRAFSFLYKAEYKWDLYRNNALYAFEKTANLNDVQSPKFVYSHIMLPHTPFMFDEFGNKVDPSQHLNWKDKQYYLNQYAYTVKLAKKLILELVKKPNNPIIILQSDHGPRPTNSPGGKQNLAIPEEEMYKIFLALHIPGYSYENINEDLSPIDVFPKIIDFCFSGTSINLENRK